MAIYAQESQETGEKSTTEVVVTSADASQEVENEDQQNNEVAEEKAETTQDSENIEGAAGSVGAPQDMNGAIANMETATRATGESRVMTTSSTGDSRVVENVRITVETKNDDGSEKLEYLTGEPIKAFAGFTISDTNSEMRNTKLRLKIPKENIQIGTIGSFDVNTTNAVRSDTTTEYVATWSFDRVIGGQLGDVPFTFNMIQPQTPDGFVVPVTVEFLDENDNVLKTTTKNFVGKTQTNPVVFKEVYAERSSGECVSHRCDAIDIDGKSVKVKKITGLQDNEMINTKNGNDAPYAIYAIGIDATLGEYGKYSYKTMKVVEKLPAGAKMYGEPDSEGYYTYYNNKWKYDARTHTAIHEGPIHETSYYRDAYRQWVNIQLSFPDQPYATIHENKATVILEPGTTAEVQLNEIKAYNKWEAEKYVPPPPRVIQ